MKHTDHTAGPVIALAGNPNVGKSTLFNRLTGMNQHTGNWPGKTVSLAQGTSNWQGQTYTFVDLPGTYSLRCRSPEEEVAQSFLESGDSDCVIIVCDATALERNLILTQQVLAIHPRAVLCVNLIDEAEKSNIRIDAAALEKHLGIPVAATAANSGRQLDTLMELVQAVVQGTRICHPNIPKAPASSADLIARAEMLASLCIRREESAYAARQLHWDRLLTHKMTGFIVMILLLLLTVWLTISGANYPSILLQKLFSHGGVALATLLQWLNVSHTLSSILLDGVYDTVTRVVSVMLPPMAIFFPLFTLLEDVGYLPRAAFLLDHRLAQCGTCGKQALTMCMGLGCNAVGVTGCRIIDSPRERLIAMVTNSLLPCNGRFPSLILIASIFFAGLRHSLMAALIVTGFIILGVLLSMICSRILSRTILKGQPSTMVLEMPPYRRPMVGHIVVRSVLDRTVFILGRALAVSAPAGLLIWCCGHLTWDGSSLLAHCARVLETPAGILGLSGPILLSFILSFPANELFFPILIMTLTGASGMGSDLAAAETGSLLLRSGWSMQTALCTMIFMVFHWPCGTTLLTVYRETKKVRWVVVAFLLPTLLGVILCIMLNLLL